MKLIPLRFLVLLVPSLWMGCSPSNETSWEAGEKSTNKAPPAEEGFFANIQKKIAAGAEAFAVADDIFKEDPAAVSLLRGEASPEDWKKLDKKLLKEKAQKLKDIAQGAGITASTPIGEAESNTIREMGRRFGLSNSRIAELETMARDKLQESGSAPSANFTAPPTQDQAVHRKPPGSSRFPPPEEPQTDSVSRWQRGGRGNPLSSASGLASGHSSEMQEIIRRREERLMESMKTDPKTP